MTTVAIRDGVIASDSAVLYNSVFTGTMENIFEVEDGWYAGAGSVACIMATVRWLRIKVASGVFSEAPALVQSEDAHGLVLLHNGSVRKVERGEVYPITGEFHAIGSGFEIAIGAMAAGLSAERAVHIACEFDAQSGPPVMAMRVKK